MTLPIAPCTSAMFETYCRYHLKPSEVSSQRAVARSDPGEAYARAQPHGGVLRRTRGQLAHDALSAQLLEDGRPLRGWLAAPLTRLDGREFGLIHVFDKEGDDFSQVDAEMLVQLAQMAAAAIERVQLYTGGRRVR